METYNYSWGDESASLHDSEVFLQEYTPKQIVTGDADHQAFPDVYVFVSVILQGRAVVSVGSGDRQSV